MIFLTCGEAWSLPQDWQCDNIIVKKVKELQHDNASYRNLYYGENTFYSLSLELEGMYDFPSAILSCGTTGCSGTITDRKTGVSENMHFDCSFTKDDDVFSCHRIASDEYLFSLDKQGKYVVELCGSYQLYIETAKCKQCHCVAHDSRKELGGSDRQLNCYHENERQIRCFSYFGYENWRNYENAESDFNNCVGLKL